MPNCKIVLKKPTWKSKYFKPFLENPHPKIIYFFIPSNNRGNRKKYLYSKVGTDLNSPFATYKISAKRFPEPFNKNSGDTNPEKKKISIKMNKTMAIFIEFKIFILDIKIYPNKIKEKITNQTRVAEIMTAKYVRPIMKYKNLFDNLLSLHSNKKIENIKLKNINNPPPISGLASPASI
ncbi:MAG: hypothetical protein ACTSRZ_19895 [Promethearchaeota archaeon]